MLWELRSAFGMFMLIGLSILLPMATAGALVYGALTVTFRSLSAGARILGAVIAGAMTYVGLFVVSQRVGQMLGFLLVVLVPGAVVALPTWIGFKHWIPAISRGRRAVVVVLLTAVTLVALQIATLDGLSGVAYGLIVPDDTEYAPNYSSASFRRVALGMSPEQVGALLGISLNEWSIDGTPTRSGRSWSRSRHDSHYRVRVVVFQDGRVKEKHAYFYLD